MVGSDADGSARHTTAGASKDGTSLTDAMRAFQTTLPTYERDGGAWPTPNAALINDSESPSSFHRRKDKWKGTYHNSVPLEVAAKESCPTGLSPLATPDGPTSSPPTPTSLQQFRWPTPMGRDGDSRRCPSSPTSGHMMRKAEDGAVNAAGMPSDDLSRAAAFWPTPRAISGGAESATTKKALLREQSGGGDLQSAAQAWPTPAARDERTPNLNETHATDQLNNVSARFQTPRAGLEGPPGEDPTHGGQPAGKRLNPIFVEWLMGFPKNWTNLAPVASIDFARWVTQSFRLSRALLSSNSPENSLPTDAD